MIRVINRHTAAIEKIQPGQEGDLPESEPVRALVRGGLLDVVGRSSRGASPDRGDLDQLFREWESREDSWRERLMEKVAECNALLARVEELSSALDAARSDGSKSARALRDELAGVRAELANVRAELAAVKAADPPSPPVEG